MAHEISSSCLFVSSPRLKLHVISFCVTMSTSRATQTLAKRHNYCHVFLTIHVKVVRDLFFFFFFFFS